MSDRKRGLYKKFEVSRIGDDGKHKDCNYFVLDLNHDPHAIRAMHRYIYSCQEEYPLLAKDLRELLAKIQSRYTDEMV